MSQPKSNVVALPRKEPSDREISEALNNSSRSIEKHLSAIHKAYNTYLMYGWKPVLLYPGKKRPVGNNWLEKPAPTIDDFNGYNNIGIAMGDKSGDLADVDIDHPDLIPHAAYFLPDTGAKFGRYYGTPDQKLAHLLYRCQADKTYVIKHPLGGVALELRSTGGQTVLPPSFIYDKDLSAMDLVCWAGGVASEAPALETIPTVQYDSMRRSMNLFAATVFCKDQFKEGSFHVDTLAWCGLLAKAEYTREEARRSVSWLVEHTGQTGLDDRLASLDDTFEKYQQGESVTGISTLKDSGWDEKYINWLRNLFKIKVGIESDGRPQVRVVASKETELFDITLDAMIATRKFYSFGGQIVVINRENGFDGAVTARMTPLADSTAMGAWLTREIQFIQSTLDKTAQQYKDALIKAPSSLAIELANPHTFRGEMPQVTGISNIPLITRKGRVIDDHWGYDPELKAFFACRFPVRKMHPDEALAILAEPFSDFPFSLGGVAGVEKCDPLASGEDGELCSLLGERYGRYLAAAMSAILAAVVRPAMDICPMYVVTSSQWGDGKSVLCSLIAAAIGMEGGSPNSPLTRGGSDEEQEKQISSVLAKGKRVIVYDNHDGEFRSPALTEVLTSQMPEFRILGKSETKTIPNRSMYLTNGVNIVLAGDLQTRSVLIRLARTDMSAHRKFRHIDVVDWASQNSEKLVSAAISLIEWSLKQDNHQWTPTHRFKIWDMLVRRTVMHACGVDISPPVNEDNDRTINPVEEVKQDFLHWVCTLWEGGLRDKIQKNWIRGRTLAEVVGPGSVQEGWIDSLSRHPNQSLDIKIGRCLNAVKDYPFSVDDKLYRLTNSIVKGLVVYKLERLV